MANDQKVGTAELLYKRAAAMGLEPTWLIPNGLFAITTAGSEKYINFACSPLNSHIGAALAKNKYLARVVLDRHGLPNIPYARPKTFAQAEDFFAEHGKIIVKPLRGHGSRDIHIVTSMDQLRDMNINEYIFEKYITGKEMRYLILNGAVIAVHQSEYGTSVDEHRPLQRISYPEDGWDPELTALSLRIADVLGLRFAAVDYLIDTNGTAHILEVNTTPGLKWFHAPTSGPVVDVANLFLQAMLVNESQRHPLLKNSRLGAQPNLAYS